MEISKCINIGSKLSSELIDIDITSDNELQKIGSVNALLLLNKKNNCQGCVNKLYALEGAIQGIRWHDLAVEERSILKTLYYKKTDNE